MQNVSMPRSRKASTISLSEGTTERKLAAQSGTSDSWWRSRVRPPRLPRQVSSRTKVARKPCSGQAHLSGHLLEGDPTEGGRHGRSVTHKSLVARRGKPGRRNVCLGVNARRSGGHPDHAHLPDHPTGLDVAEYGRRTVPSCSSTRTAPRRIK